VNGQTLLGAYRAPTGPAAIGTITVDFAATDRATVTFSDDKSLDAKAGKVIVIRPFYTPPPVPQGRSPDAWDGYVDSTYTTKVDGASYEYITTITLMSWEKDYGPDAELATLVQFPAKYRIGSLLGDLSVHFETMGCSGDGGSALTDLEGEMTLQADGRYSARISKVVPLSISVRCDGFSMVIPVEYPVDFLMEGGVVNGRMAGELPPNAIPELTRTGSWYFSSRNN
jgi:hypothetical protein